MAAWSESLFTAGAAVEEKSRAGWRWVVTPFQMSINAESACLVLCTTRAAPGKRHEASGGTTSDGPAADGLAPPFHSAIPLEHIKAARVSEEGGWFSSRSDADLSFKLELWANGETQPASAAPPAVPSSQSAIVRTFRLHLDSATTPSGQARQRRDALVGGIEAAARRAVEQMALEDGVDDELRRDLAYPTPRLETWQSLTRYELRPKLSDAQVAYIQTGRKAATGWFGWPGAAPTSVPTSATAPAAAQHATNDPAADALHEASSRGAEAMNKLWTTLCEGSRLEVALKVLAAPPC